jgi:hypothetical protein
MEKKKDWVVTMECVVTKELYLSGCTEEEAENDPWLYATDEKEVEMNDWQVVSIEKNN